MKLKAKMGDEDIRVGEIVEADRIMLYGVRSKAGGVGTFHYSSIEDFLEDWGPVDVGAKSCTHIDEKDKFEEWEKNGIRSELAKVIIAPEDYVDGDKKYFTWDEAMALDLPDGWRLPTRREWVLISEEFACCHDGELSADELIRNLKLNKNGWIDGRGQLHELDANGSYWSSVAYSTATVAHGFDFGSDYLYPQYYYSKGFGFSVRLVKDMEEKE